eukprot:gene19432-14069_t
MSNKRNRTTATASTSSRPQTEIVEEVAEKDIAILPGYDFSELDPEEAFRSFLKEIEENDSRD